MISAPSYNVPLPVTHRVDVQPMAIDWAQLRLVRSPEDMQVTLHHYGRILRMAVEAAPPAWVLSNELRWNS